MIEATNDVVVLSVRLAGSILNLDNRPCVEVQLEYTFAEKGLLSKMRLGL
jgi:hypothetical protein